MSNEDPVEIVVNEQNVFGKSRSDRDSSPEDGVDSWVEQSNTDLEDTLKKRQNSQFEFHKVVGGREVPTEHQLHKDLGNAFGKELSPR